MNLADAFHGRHVLITGGLGFVAEPRDPTRTPRAHVTILDSLIPQFGGAAVQHRDDSQTGRRQHLADMRIRTRWISWSKARTRLQSCRPGQSWRHLARSPARPGGQLRIDDEPGRSLPKFNPCARLLYTSTRQVLWPAAAAARDRGTSDPADRRQRHQQTGRRVLPPTVSQHLWDFARPSYDQHLCLRQQYSCNTN